jgi:predicted aspartyl protease
MGEIKPGVTFGRPATDGSPEGEAMTHQESQATVRSLGAGGPIGRFSIDFEVLNHQDVVAAGLGVLPPDQVRRARLSGVVDTGAARLVLPGSVVAALGLPGTGQITVRFADGRQEPRPVVGDVQVEIQNRSSVFTAVVEPARSDALIGAIVLEELDFVPDSTARTLVPRDPGGMLAEIE